MSNYAAMWTNRCASEQLWSIVKSVFVSTFFSFEFAIAEPKYCNAHIECDMFNHRNATMKIVFVFVLKLDIRFFVYPKIGFIVLSIIKLTLSESNFGHTYSLHCTCVNYKCLDTLLSALFDNHFPPQSTNGVLEYVWMKL